MLGFLASLLALGPGAGVAPEPAPAHVALAWTSDAHTSAVISWEETGDVRNKIDIVGADGSPTHIASQFAEAGEPNQVPMFAGLFDNDYRILVRVVDADGNDLSEPATSPEFDTDREPPAVFTSVVPREDGSILMTWRPGPYTDSNPGDPLDVPPHTPYRYVPFASVVGFNDIEELAAPTTARSFVVPPRESPLNVGLRNVPNEWYGYGGESAVVDGNRLTAKIPSSATIGGGLTMTGTAVRLVRQCDPGPCWVAEGDDRGRELRLQRRTGAGAPWRTVASTKAREGGAYSFTVGFAASGDYRVVAPAVPFAPDRTVRSFVASDVTTVRGVAAGGGDHSGLPITGAPAAWTAAAGGLLVLLGGLAATAGRARRRHPRT